MQDNWDDDEEEQEEEEEKKTGTVVFINWQLGKCVFKDKEWGQRQGF